MFELALLLQQGNTASPGPLGLARFFMGFFLIAFIYIGALSFTYWISKDE